MLTELEKDLKQNHANRKSKDYFRPVFELFFVLFIEIVLLDWFTSLSDPYPYSVSVPTAFAVTLALGFTLWLGIDKLHSTFTISRSVVPNALKFNLPLKAVVLTAYATIALLLWKVLVPDVGFATLRNHLLGDGMGTYSEGNTAASFSTILLNEWGSAAILVLIGLVLFGCAGCVLLLFRAVDEDCEPIRIVLSLTGFGLIAGLLFKAQWGPTFLTVNTMSGTWLFSAALGAIGVATSPRARERQNETAHAKRHTPLIVWPIFVVVILLGVVITHFCLHQRVSSVIKSRVEHTRLASTSQSMQDATISMEDGHFYQHHGFDWTAMHRALRMDIRAGHVVEGGSTITQQLAKNLFLTNDRTIWRKIEEAAYTVELEHDLSKGRILELYLNAIDYGYGNHGITAAAHYYYHETPAQLTLAQSAVLVGLVPSPPKITSSSQAGEPQYEDLEKLESGEQTAIGRIRFFFSNRYTQSQGDTALNIPLDRLLYPYKDAWDRGAVDTIPETWHDVSFYSFVDPSAPADIPNVAPCLMPHLAAFLDEAHATFGLCGIDHLGVYNDRGMRQANELLSAHAFGQAIDISGFRFSNGSEVLIKDHGQPSALRKLLPMEKLLKRHFDIVVDWKSDPLRHQTHFHCEVLGPRLNVQRSADYVPLGVSQSYKIWNAGLEVRQTHAASCGAAALATVFTYYLNRPTSENGILRLMGSDGSSGVGTTDLLDVCKHEKLYAKWEQLSLSTLLNKLNASTIPIPVLVSVPDGHFIDLVGVNGGDVVVSDPADGNRLESISDFARQWSGGALLISAPERGGNDVNPITL